MENIIYPGVTDRIKAMLADSVILVIQMAIAAYSFSMFEYVPELVKKIAFIFIFLLYDPLFTSIFGGTIGHMMFGLRVKREHNLRKNILFPIAIARYVIKAVLGWISLLTVMSNKKRKAIHDYVTGSIVVYNELLLSMITEADTFTAIELELYDHESETDRKSLENENI